MIVLLNPKAAGGAAERRWDTIRSQVQPKSAAMRTYVIETPERLQDVVAREVARGETEFVAAGGDGTVNGALNALLGAAGSKELPRVRLGAVGLGSSNDFHKPLGRRERIGGIPVSLRFADARPRDVGRLTVVGEGDVRVRHFLVSASVGFAARANRRFNRPGALLGRLKRASPRASIHAVVLRTLITWRNLPVTLRFDEDPKTRVSLTNLSVLLSPHIGGEWRCGDSREAGGFRIHLCRSLGRVGILRVLRDLRQGRVAGNPAVSVRGASYLSVDAARPLEVELDGEVLEGRGVRFDVLREALWVCP